MERRLATGDRPKKIRLADPMEYTMGAEKLHGPSTKAKKVKRRKKGETPKKSETPLTNFHTHRLDNGSSISTP